MIWLPIRCSCFDQDIAFSNGALNYQIFWKEIIAASLLSLACSLVQTTRLYVSQVKISNYSKISDKLDDVDSPTT